jgi:hypothetical protein
MRNICILDKMRVTPITEYVNNYRQKWLKIKQSRYTPWRRFGGEEV